MHNIQWLYMPIQQRAIFFVIIFTEASLNIIILKDNIQNFTWKILCKELCFLKDFERRILQGERVKNLARLYIVAMFTCANFPKEKRLTKGPIIFIVIHIMHYINKYECRNAFLRMFIKYSSKRA